MSRRLIGGGRIAPLEIGRERTARDALRDAVSYALAAYGIASNQEIKVLDWLEVGFDLEAIELAAREKGHKPSPLDATPQLR